MDYQGILDEIKAKVNCSQLEGKVASYIPELAKVDPEKFGMHLCNVMEEEFCFGDFEERFSIQSITKVLTLSMALLYEDEKLWRRVGVEPSGDPFNSLVQLEYEHGIPRNPLINSGALVVCDVLVSHLEDPKKEYLGFVQQITGNTSIDYDSNVAESEKATGFHNRAMINLMKAYGNIENDVEEVLDFYFYTCAIAMSCRELAHTFLLFAKHGNLSGSDHSLLSVKRTKRINAIMQTCGFYDEAGEFSFRVGLPGKSGVGGGIVAIYPNMYSVATWSPKLNQKGNSTAGMEALEQLTNMTGSSIF
ncbi:MAG: glutaminase [Bacteroidota bacterium]